MKGKKPSTDSEVQKTLLDRQIPARAAKFLELFTEWGEYHTMVSRYLKGFEKHIKDDGRIHTTFSIAIAATGRVSSRSPNLMNNPKRTKSAKKIRRLIAAPAGWKLIAVDEAQSELRWFAHVANDTSMQEVFRRGEDIHTNTARELTIRGGEDWGKLTPAEIEVKRRNAKAINFGLLFLMSRDGFIKYAKLKYEIDLSPDEADSWMSIFFSTYGGVKPYHKETIDFCRRTGYVESPLGRRRRFAEINSENKGLRHEAERQAVNHPIQSPSSDTVLLACNQLVGSTVVDRDLIRTTPYATVQRLLADAFHKRVRHGKGLLDLDRCRPVLFIHDELVFISRDDSKVEDDARAIKWAMENPPFERDFGIKMRVPLQADVKVGYNLAEMTKANL